jgi:dipeptidyl aminopeptidase/acylaminoacyl peptidase
MPVPRKGGRLRSKSTLIATLAVAASTMSTAAHAAVDEAQLSSHALADDAKAFGSREFVRDVDISPSGQKVLLLVSAAGAATTANIIDVGTSKITRVVESTGRPQRLYWCSFAGEQHVVCKFGGVDHIGDDLANFSRLITVNADGTKLRQLGQQESDRNAYVMQSDGDIVDWMTSAEGRLLMERSYVPEVQNTGHLISRSKEGLGVDLVDLDTLKASPVEPPRNEVGGYLSDGRGNIRIMSISGIDQLTGQLTGATTVRYRLAGGRDWADLAQYDDNSRLGLYPLAVDAEQNVLFARQRVNGRDALVRVALDGSKTITMIAKNDRVDIDDVVRFGRGQRVIGYTYADEKRHVVYFDPEFGKLQSALASALKLPQIDFEESSRDGQQLLIRASSDTNPGTFYVFSRPTHSLLEVGQVRPQLEGRTLAQVQPIEVPAPDGVMIPAYLTLPPGSSGKNLPAVVLPHGGPSARDEWGFDWLSQFFAARGYVVIQPEFRGSDGYGDAWLNKNGFQNWRTSIGDVTAAAKYLVSKGIADPNRIAIFGWSYGGYAALQSAVVEPTLYKAAIAVAPVTDFAMVKAEAEDFTISDLVKREIGAGPHIVEGSPLQNAQRIKVPVLLVHGDMDTNVNIRESQAMEAALKKSGTPVEMLTFAGLDHQVDDSDARTAMLTKAGELLDRTIGH